MEALSHVDDGGDDRQRPTPLDPEYWRGITHSFDQRQDPAVGTYDAYPVAQPQAFAVTQHAQYPHASPVNMGGVYQAMQRPMTAPSMTLSGPFGYASGSIPTSPTNYAGMHALPISPVAYQPPMHGARFDNRRSMDWGLHQGYASTSTPQGIRAEVRELFARAQSFVDLPALLRSYDPSMTGALPVQMLQDAFATVGVMLSSHLLNGIAQHFGLPANPGMIDYNGFSRILELDAHELDQLRMMLTASRQRMHSSGLDIVQLMSQNDVARSGFISRSLFITILRECGVMIGDGTLHFLLQQLSRPFDSNSICYTRFLELVGVRAYPNDWASPIHAQAFATPRTAGEVRSSLYAAEPFMGSIEPPFAAPTIQTRRGSYVENPPTVQISLPRHGWICRVCAHQQVEDWITNCEVCDTSKPKTGKYGGFLKCSHCKFDNNFDMDDCEMCGRPLASGAKRPRSAKRSKRRHHRRDSSSSGSEPSGSSSDSSGRSRRSSRRSSDKKRSGSSSRTKSPRRPLFHRGEEIQAIPVGERDFAIGVIARVHSDGTYDVDFDNGKQERHIDERCIREISRARIVRAEEASSSRAQKEEDVPRFDEGDRIEAQFGGGERFFSGTIQRKRSDGTYDVVYDDSEVETKVKARFIRKLKPKSPTKSARKESPRKPAQSETDASSSDVAFTKGQKVEVKLKGSAGYVKGSVYRSNSDGTYDVEFDTGELEKHVPSNCIRTRSGSSPKKAAVMQSDDEPIKPKRPVSNTARKPAATDSSSEGAVRMARKFREGQKVEAKFKGGEKFYPGVISRSRLNGTYDVEYDDGEKETGVKADNIRDRQASSPSKGKASQSSDTDFTIGQKIEARYKGKDKYYPGVIARSRFVGTYDIDYDDGEKEQGVDVALIRARGSGNGKRPPASSDDEPAKKTYRVGQPVQARYKGKDSFYPGTISRARSNGTYDIEYDDGEKETEVPANYIQEKEGKKSPAKKPSSSDSDAPPAKKLKQGDKVEAQYKGKSKFYPGVIARCRLNGTYDIDYDDGEKETGVAAELIRLKDGGSSSPTKKKPADDSEDDRKGGKKYREGDKVEAQYKGKSKFYPGVISRARLNGTYDIDYDDGEKETGVAAELIRARGGSSSGSSGSSGGSSSAEKTTKKYREGDKVEAQYKGKSKYYPGVIARARLNGTYDIDYDDGEKETGVAPELIRSRASGSDSDDKPSTRKLREGDKVEAQYKGKSKFYPGVISRCRLNGTYDIDYDDGEKETGVAAELVRLRGGSASPSKKKSVEDSEDDRKPAKKFREGEKVEAQYKGKSKFYPGVISRCRLNGTYDIDYDDGEKETGVAAELIRSRGGGSTSPSKSRKSTDDTSEDDRKGGKKFREGEKVEAQYKGKSKFYPGVISRCRLNGTYDIDYDDGEKETGVAAELIRSRESSGSPKKKSVDDSEDDRKPSKKFREGEKVEAQYKGKSKFYPGVISRCRLNGTYDIDYDDGEKETGVAAELIRSKEASSPSKKKPAADSSEDDRQSKKFKEGEKVEAQYKGKSKFYPGVISRCRLNGTYDIDYDDGEKESGVAAELIRSKGGSSPSKKKASADTSEDDSRGGAKKFKEGEKVEAQYKGKSKFYPGVISRCRLNGTYDIDYDDGEKETGVAAELIRSRESSSGSGARKLREGDKVETQYKGKSKFYPGVIARCRLNGTYDIDYDDGEKETGVAAELIRLKDGGSSSPTKKKPADDSEDDRKGGKKYREGDKVEAQYKGKSKFYPGVISRARLNGTYDIDYDDGEKETGVAAELIRARGGSSSGSSGSSGGSSSAEKTTKKYREGDKVEAQYKGKSKYYPGVIARARLNGTYDIDYDDGEKETGVAPELIRSRASGSDSDDKPSTRKLREGDKVEAQYKGKSKFYPGVISRCRLNGTYDIDYDDGEKETGVAAELVRLRGGSASPSKKKSVEDSEDDRKPAKKFREGEKVEAQYKGKSKFYPGVISRCRLNGTYDIDYDDGEKETGVAAELIRSRGGGSTSPSKSRKSTDDTSEDDRKGGKKFREGEKVEAQYKGKSKFYPGVISRCRLNGTYDIDYDDGEKETGVAAELIRSRESSGSPKKKSVDDSEDDRKPSKKFREGEKVEAQYKGKSKFYPGVISRCRLNGTYDIDYDDGEKETGVAAELIRSKEASSPSKKKPAADSSEDDRQSKKFKEGEKVEAQYKGKSKFYPGVISRCRLNGTYDIDYDDGEKESGVAAELIRSKGGSSPSKKKASADTSEDDSRGGAKKFKEGEKVEAQYKGKSKFYPGVISRCRLNGTYDIDYDDGEKETGVAAELIRSLEKKSSKDDDSKGSSKKFREGEKVEAQYKGKSKFYPGVISRCRLNGTYDIDYDDGEKETGVAAELIRSRESSSGSGARKLREGDKVEAQYKGKSKFYPGVIARCRLNGTYDIDYDDGEKETGVAAELIRLKDGGSSSPTKKKPADDSEDDRKGGKKYREGDKVEAQYKGKSKFYPGVISRARLNGTYDIDYDDGEKETGVAAELIRARGGSSSGSSGSSGGSSSAEKTTKKYREGDKVEAQYKGKSKYYPGVIARARLNGTYDIDYDDGEKETGVAPELIRSRASGSDSDDKPSTRKLREGDKVEAQYKGKSKFYPGVISRCRLNGTYDIDYDDGEKETGVAAELVRLRGGSASPSKKKSVEDSEDDRKPAKKFREGEKVEAQYKGKSKFYPGVISRCRLNGTYDIDYDDGEKETGVAAELIRSRGGGSTSPSKSRKSTDDTSEDDRKGGKKFREGEKVEAQYKGKSKFYPGVISRCRLNGTYDIDYDDGEKETGVAAELIRSRESSGSPKKKSADDADFGRSSNLRVDTSQAYRVGARVEALFRGKDKYFKGTVSRANSDGSYDIEYDDGDKETKVPPQNIRPLKASSNFSATTEFSASRPSRPAASGGGRRRSGNSSD